MSWKTVELGDICEFTRGLTYSKLDEIEFSNNAVLRATNIDLETNKLNLEEIRYINGSVKIKEDKKVKLNDILICTASGSKSHLGKVALIEEQLDMAFGGFMAVLRVKEIVEAKFLFNYLTSDIFLKHISRLADGANINNLKFSQIQNLKINLPSLATQQKIVAKLDAIFAEIDTAMAAAEANAKNTEILFQRYLTEIYERGGEGWKRKTIDEITDKTKNVSPDKSPGLEFTYVDVSSISNTTYSIISTQKILGKDAPSRAKKNIITNDILFATVRPTLKRIAIVPEFLDNQVASTGYVVLRTNNKNYHKFLFYYLFTSTFNKAMETLQRGASYPAVTDSDVKSQNLLVPSYEEQVNLSEKLENINSNINIKIKLELRKIEELKALKQSILQRAFSGELVKD